jgi:hypothetical protein
MGTRIVALAVFAAGEAFCFEMLKRRAVESRLGAGTDNARHRSAASEK